MAIKHISIHILVLMAFMLIGAFGFGRPRPRFGRSPLCSMGPPYFGHGGSTPGFMPPGPPSLQDMEKFCSSFMAPGGRNLVQESENKKLVMKFYQEFFGDQDYSAADRYLYDDFIQHNPYIPDGKEGVKKFFQGFVKERQLPKGKVRFYQTGAEGDLVFLRSNGGGGFPAFPSTSSNFTIFSDVYRVENGKICEHWDAIQTGSPPYANDQPFV